MTPPASAAGAIRALDLHDVTVVRNAATLLGPLDWSIAATERWAVLGANGCGKSTLLKVAAMHLHPTTGSVHLLGEQLGHTDVRQLRTRVGYSSAALAESFRETITCRDVVMTARFAALEPWWHAYTDADRARADSLLAHRGSELHADRPFNSLSSGERQRVLLARTLMNDPAVVLLDEPTAALDLGGRERLLAELNTLAGDPAAPAMALVTHHVEEIPRSFTHVLLLKRGQAVASGPIDETLTAEALSETFEMALRLVEIDGRRFGVSFRSD